MAIFPGSAIPSGVSAYTIDYSCRFNPDDDGILSFTPGSASDRRTWTISFWTKRSAVVGDISFMGVTVDPDNFNLRFNSTGLNLYNGGSSPANNVLQSAGNYTDPAAWYHIVYAVDTTQAVDTNRAKMYVNGIQVTDLAIANYPDINTEWQIGNTTPHIIGAYNSLADPGSQPYDGYFAEWHYINALQLTPSSFGETNSATNQWVPIEYTGAYGTNGFYLKFQDSAALGDDSSGNGNDFTVTNLVATDQVLDSPTNNFAVLNPIARRNQSGGIFTFSEGNLKFYNQYGEMHVNTTISVPTPNKWYWESMFTDNVPGSNSGCGIFQTDDGSNQGGGQTSLRWISSGSILTRTGGSDTTLTTGKTFTENDVLGIFVDGNDVLFYKNGTLEYTAASVLTATSVREPFWKADDGDYFRVNFGADSSFAGEVTAQGNTDANGKGDFYQTVPTGGLALCTSNLPSPEIALPGENFNTIIYDDGAGAKTGVGFQPDLVWVKSRGSAYDHKLTDAVRGVTKAIVSNDTSAETTDSTGLTAFGADGFTVGADTDYSDTTGTGMVGWNWKAGGAPTTDNVETAGATPTAGSVKIDGSNLGSALAGTIAATRLSANTTSGFSIVTWEGTGAIGTVAHGLSVAPELVMVKNFDMLNEWPVGTDKGGYDFTDYLRLDGNRAMSDDDRIWNDTDPSATVFTVGAHDSVNNSGDGSVSYCFHSVEGYSKVGSYKGNGFVNGPFVYTGFKPAMVIIKQTTTANWFIFDDARDTYNVVEDTLKPSTSDAETDVDTLDFVSNGFKLRNNSGTSSTNDSGVSIIYLAFAESPFKYSNAR